MGIIDYTGENVYRGVLYGKSSMAVYDRNGVEHFHTGARKINTLEELQEFVEGFEEFLERLMEEGGEINERAKRV